MLLCIMGTFNSADSTALSFCVAIQIKGYFMCVYHSLTGCCERDNELSDLIKCEEFLE